MANEILMTKEGFDGLKAELEYLKTEKRKEISEKIRIARGFGDLSENSEYDEAKNDQALLEARILTLEEQIKNVKILDANQISGECVSVGTKVVLLDLEYKEEMEYKIVSSVESGADENAITDESPVGKAIVGHKVGDVVTVHAPAGEIQFKVLKISI